MRFEFGRDRILVVTDSPHVQGVLTEPLRDAGYSVTFASSRRDALWCLRTAPPYPGAIVLDFHLPEFDGYEFHATLSRSGSWQDVPLVLLPATEDLSPQAAAIGAIEVLQQPLDPRQLISLLRTIFEAEGIQEALAQRNLRARC